MGPHGRLIGITGRAQAGKTTLAEAIVALAGGQIIACADSLRDVALAAFGSRFETQQAKASRVDFWAERLGPQWATGRQILQRIGSELFREQVHPDFWLFHLENKLLNLPAQPVIVVPDIRFDNEARWVRDHGGQVVLVRRLGHPLAADDHVSERGIAADLVDQTIVSDSVAQTQSWAPRLLAQPPNRAALP